MSNQQDPDSPPVEELHSNEGRVTVRSTTNRYTQTENKGKSFLTAFLLSYFLGVFGIDRFYLGYIGAGILKLLTFGGCTLWAFIDWVLILAGALKDSQGQPLTGREAHMKTAIIILIATGVLSFVILILNIILNIIFANGQPSSLPSPGGIP